MLQTVSQSVSLSVDRSVRLPISRSVGPSFFQSFGNSSNFSTQPLTCLTVGFTFLTKIFVNYSLKGEMKAFDSLTHFNWFPLGLNSPHSPLVIKSTATAAPVTTSKCCAEHRSFIPINSPAALCATPTSSAADNNTQSVSQENAHPSRRESADPYVSCSPSVTAYTLLKESAGKPYDSGSQSFTEDSLLTESTTKPCGSGPQSFTLKAGKREGSLNEGDLIKVQGLCKGLPLSCV